MAMSAGGLIRILGLQAKRGLATSQRGDAQEISSMTGKDLLDTYMKEEGKGCAHSHISAREDCLLICYCLAP